MCAILLWDGKKNRCKGRGRHDQSQACAWIHQLHGSDQITEYSDGAEEQENALADQRRNMTYRGKIWKIFLLCLGMVRAASACSSDAQHIPLVPVILLPDLCCGWSLIHPGAGGVSGCGGPRQRGCLDKLLAALRKRQRAPSVMGE